MPRVGIALGSNLGDRLAHLRTAFDCLREISLLDGPFLSASIYQTEPKLCPPDSPPFYNSVAEFCFDGTPTKLLEITQNIEKKMGRNSTHIRNAPRIIDLDLLYFGDQIIATEGLVLPHPRLSERRFVLQPLAEICPQLILPGYHQPIIALLDQLHSDEPPLIRVGSAF